MTKHDRGSTPGNDSDEWRSPLPLVRSTERHLGITFIADMAATPENALCPIYFTKHDNPLRMTGREIRDRIGPNAHPDQGHALWNNPPYGSTGLDPWIVLAHQFSSDYGFPWVLPLPASRTEQSWMYVRPACDYKVTFLRHRVPYLREDGTPGKAPNHPSLLITFPGHNPTIKGGTFSLLAWKAKA